MDQNKKIVMTSLRMPKELHEQLRKAAFARRRPLHALILEGAANISLRYQAAAEQKQPEA